MFDLLGDVAQGAVMGGPIGAVLGLVGNGISAFAEYKQRKLANEHTLASRRLDLEEMDKEIAHAQILAGIEAQKETEISADQAFSLSQTTEHDLDIQGVTASPFISFLLGAVEAVRRFTRPGLAWLHTVTVFVMLGVLLSTARDLQIALTADQVSTMIQTVIAAIVTVYTAAALWYYGQRYLRPKFDGGITKG